MRVYSAYSAYGSNCIPEIFVGELVNLNFDWMNEFAYCDAEHWKFGFSPPRPFDLGCQAGQYVAPSPAPLGDRRGVDGGDCACEGSLPNYRYPLEEGTSPEYFPPLPEDYRDDLEDFTRRLAEEAAADRPRELDEDE